MTVPKDHPQHPRQHRRYHEFPEGIQGPDQADKTPRRLGARLRPSQSYCGLLSQSGSQSYCNNLYKGTRFAKEVSRVISSELAEDAGL